MRLVIDLQGAQGASAERGIGRYSRELALAMAREARGHEVIIALNGALQRTAERLRSEFAAILPPANIRLWYPPAGISELRESPLRPAAEILRAQFLASLAPDLVHVSSLFEGLTDDVVTCSPVSMPRLPLVATCYDLIPLIRRDEYFGPGGALTVGSRWYYRVLQEMSLCDGLLAISESSRGEAIGHLGFPQDRIFDVQAGIHGDFRRAELAGADRERFRTRYGISKPFILFLGAGDIRKNEAGLIAAYARLPQHLRSAHQLVIVGKMEPEELRKIATEHGVPAEAFIVIHFVAESDLAALYSECALFVFPSFHEGFGLPVAEAMACGAPVIASNSSSLPEVAGRPDILFDPADPADIARRMAQVLDNPTFRAELAAYGPAQAGRFTWCNSAGKAWDALEQLHAARQAAECHTTRRAVSASRPRLAFISPLPPQASGIADYSAELVPALARHYDITLVCEDGAVGDPRLASSFPCLDVRRFAAVANQFDRILYQVGNSPFHRFQLEGLLQQAPGVVVVHDVSLSGYLNWLAGEKGDRDSFRADLYASHGYPGLKFDVLDGRDAAIARFPCTLPVLQAALGTIVHSHHAKTLLATHFGTEVVADTSVIPHLRSAVPLPEKAAARASLGLPADAFVIASFGIVARKKLPGLLLRAWREAGCPGPLVFVGEALPEALVELDALLPDQYDAPIARITGRVTVETYRRWLAAADIAVQLRRASHGETSGAIADCLGAGVPLIINEDGAAAELPAEVAFILPPDPDEKALAEAIRYLHDHPQHARTMADAARNYARQVLDPAAIAARYRDSIEGAYARQDQAIVARHLAQLPLAGDALANAVRAVVTTFPGKGTPRLLVDISGLSRGASSPGLFRITREVMRRALTEEPTDLRGEAVRVHGGRLRVTHKVPLAVLGFPPLPLPELPVDTRPGDVLLCIDINMGITPVELAELRRLRLAGLRIVLAVHDMLALRKPHLLPEQMIGGVREWYCQMLLIADDVVCTSRAVADDLIAWLGEENGRRDRPLRIGYFQPGGDFPSVGGDRPLSAEASGILRRVKDVPTFLMVGTIEAWKGYRQALAAFERLWPDGHAFNLVIAGELGSSMEDFARQLRASPASGRTLFWLDSCSDADLRALYESCTALIMASGEEGFGLPIVEAYHSGLPVIARDIPVFREVAGEAATFFAGDEPEVLAAAVLDWISRDQAGEIPGPGAEAVLSWDESYRQLRPLLFGGGWYSTWNPERAK
jgi:glycosyltransferase involved in cell wall biosynthesis